TKNYTKKLIINIYKNLLSIKFLYGNEELLKELISKIKFNNKELLLDLTNNYKKFTHNKAMPWINVEEYIRYHGNFYFQEEEFKKYKTLSEYLYNIIKVIFYRPAQLAWCYKELFIQENYDLDKEKFNIALNSIKNHAAFIRLKMEY